jgi:hypothetical protein
MRQRLWRGYVRFGEIRQSLLRKLMPRRMQVVAHSWPLRPASCPCDVHFCEYLEQRQVRGKSIFHFGTGGHHVVGKRNHAQAWANDILGLTVSPREHAIYVRQVIRDPALGAHYKVLFSDIYSMSGALLPAFDLITLFHLCEFEDRASAGRRLDDAGLVQLFCERLTPGGRLFLYRGSFGYPRAAPLIGNAVAQGRLSLVEEYQSLLVYQRTVASPPGPAACG